MSLGTPEQRTQVRNAIIQAMIELRVFKKRELTTHLIPHLTGHDEKTIADEVTTVILLIKRRYAHNYTTILGKPVASPPPGFEYTYTIVGDEPVELLRALIA